ncbi:MAG: hypothetical protein A2Z25_03975 [Planctomycetes bacterium RBG_16_55_9]|nr:MAG: hypothetical protein A2Z25_03975 [Planctomycetes bacterium RBG_16_55_9]
MDKPIEIPKFDLAEQILAEQRKLASVKRKAPGKRANAPTSRVGLASPIGRDTGMVGQAPPYEQSLMCSEQEQIIAEIVARDIENLVKGNAVARASRP